MVPGSVLMSAPCLGCRSLVRPPFDEFADLLGRHDLVCGVVRPERLQDLLGLEDLAGSPGAGGAEFSSDQALHRFAHQRCRDGVGVATMREGALSFVAS